MICPTCGTGVRLEISWSSVVYAREKAGHNQYGFDITHGFCPECKELIVLLRHGDYWQHDLNDDGSRELTQVDKQIIIYPGMQVARKVAPEVPEAYRKDFLESFAVFGISPKASAAISRRVLQTILREEYKIRAKNLAAEIEAFVKLPGIPTAIAEAVDAVRHIGNFAAHPLKDTRTGEVIDVEPGEAEWLIETLDALFDFTFVRPKRLLEQKLKLNAKLKAAGKPPMK